jgi:hypothetical protein
LLDRLGNEVDFTELFMEETLSAKDRKELPDSMYGIVYTDENGKKVRKYPLNDEKHVLQAVRFFNKAPEEHKPELARKIVKRAKELDMDYSGWEVLKPYLNGGKKKVVKESFMTYEWLMKQNYPDPDSTSGTSDFDESSTSSEDDVFNETFGEVMEKNLQDRMIKSNDLLPVRKPNSDEVYFASDVNYMPEIDLDRPLFVTPYKDLASIFAGRNALRSRLRGLNYNLEYEEWLNFDERKDHNPLKVVHVYVEGVPDLDPFVLEAEGYIHCILTRDYEDNFFRYPWMNDLEYLIAKTDNMKVQFFRQIKCKVKYIVEGRPWKADADKTLGRPDRLPSRLQIAKNIAKDIHEYVEKKSKEPTGNQNCLLCTWCAEAQFRGRTVLPRPVYSPRDMIFKYTNVECVKGGEKKRPRGFDNLMELLQDAGDGDHRWYCHVDWNEGSGGHEFLILKIDGKYHVMDAQQGEVGPLTSAHKYFDDVAWKGTFIVRLNNKPFDFDLLKQVNDPANTLPWDPKKDIPYMVKHGLCTKEEAEKELKKMETNLFTSELKKALNQTPIQEGLFFNKKEYTPIISDKFEEFTRAYNDPIFKSIIKNFKNMKSKDLKKYYDNRFPVNERDDWMNDNFDGTVASFEKNIDSDLVETDNRYNPIGYMFATVKNQDEWLSISMLDGCVYYCNIRDNSKVSSSFNEFLKSFNGVFDKYLKDSHIQEGAWNDIRNGVNPWSKKRVFHITKQGHLDGQIFKPRVPEYLDKYDPSKDKFEDVDNPRICFSNSIEGALNAILVNIGRWKTTNKLGDWYVYVPEKPLKEYKYRTTKQLVDEKKVYDANVTNEIWIEEPVRLKQYGIIHVDQVSDKHTKKTVPTTSGFVGHRYRYDFKYHWLVKPKVIADLPYDYSPKSVCEDMVNELSGFKYGLGYDGSIHHGSSKDFDEKYRLESPEEFEKNGGGICYDFVEWQAGYLEAYGYKCRKFFISTDTEDMDTHTFILVDDGNGKFVYPEAAFKLLEGTHIVKSPEEAALKVMDKIFDVNDNSKKYDEIKYYVWEYEGHPPYGSNMETCHKYFSKGEPFHEGTAKKIK